MSVPGVWLEKRFVRDTAAEEAAAGEEEVQGAHLAVEVK